MFRHHNLLPPESQDALRAAAAVGEPLSTERAAAVAVATEAARRSTPGRFRPPNDTIFDRDED